MSNTEPTEEQKQAAREFLCHGPSWPILARFLAEREAKLRDNIIDDDIEYYKACQAAYSTENDTLRARVAELERPNWLTTPTRSTRSRKDRLKEARERAAYRARVKAKKLEAKGATE